MDRATCFHERLYFASGSFYVLCRNCDARWAARDPQDERRPDPVNTILTLDGDRVKFVVDYSMTSAAAGGVPQSFNILGDHSYAFGPTGLRQVRSTERCPCSGCIALRALGK